MKLVHFWRGHFGEYLAPSDVMAAALNGKPEWHLRDKRTRAYKAFRAWGRWMDCCEASK